MATEKASDSGEIVFFGEVDRHPRGGFSSEYPAWYFDRQQEELKEEISRDERSIETGLVSPPNVPEVRTRIKLAKERLHEIESSKPKFSAKQKDELAGAYKEMGDQLREALPSRSDMMKGVADAHEELRRNTEPCIRVDGRIKDLAASCGISVSKGMVTRDGLAKMWKITGKALGEQSNVERLRSA